MKECSTKKLSSFQVFTAV